MWICSTQFTGGAMTVLGTDNPHLFGYQRQDGSGRVTVITNFTEQEQTLPAGLLRSQGLAERSTDLVSGETVALDAFAGLRLGVYPFMWLMDKKKRCRQPGTKTQFSTKFIRARFTTITAMGTATWPA